MTRAKVFLFLTFMCALLGTAVADVAGVYVYASSAPADESLKLTEVEKGSLRRQEAIELSLGADGTYRVKFDQSADGQKTGNYYADKSGILFFFPDPFPFPSRWDASDRKLVCTYYYEFGPEKYGGPPKPVLVKMTFLLR